MAAVVAAGRGRAAREREHNVGKKKFRSNKQNKQNKEKKKKRHLSILEQEEKQCC